jgi:hypothetical protein
MNIFGYEIENAELVGGRYCRKVKRRSSKPIITNESFLKKKKENTSLCNLISLHMFLLHHKVSAKNFERGVLTDLIAQFLHMSKRSARLYAETLKLLTL